MGGGIGHFQSSPATPQHLRMTLLAIFEQVGAFGNPDHATGIKEKSGQRGLLRGVPIRFGGGGQVRVLGDCHRAFERAVNAREMIRTSSSRMK